MFDNDFTTLSIIIMILLQHDSNHDSTTANKNTKPVLLMPLY